MTSPNDLPWTEQKEAQLKELWMRDISGSKIAAELGCRSSGSVTGKARRLGLPKRKEGSHGSYVPTPSVKAKAKPPEPPPRSKFNPFRNGTRSAAAQCVPCPPPSPLTSDQKEYILGQGIPLKDDVMEVVGQGKQAALKWSGGLQSDQCRWPINEPPRGGEYLFCGAKGHPYCPYHTQMAYQPMPGKVNLWGMRQSLAE
jgi:hypothetical protein